MSATPQTLSKRAQATLTACLLALMCACASCWPACTSRRDRGLLCAGLVIGLAITLSLILPQSPAASSMMYVAHIAFAALLGAIPLFATCPGLLAVHATICYFGLATRAVLGGCFVSTVDGDRTVLPFNMNADLLMAGAGVVSVVRLQRCAQTHASARAHPLPHGVTHDARRARSRARKLLPLARTTLR